MLEDGIQCGLPTRTRTGIRYRTLKVLNRKWFCPALPGAHVAVAGDIWVVTARQKVPLVPSEQRLSTPQSTGGPHSTAPRPRTPAAPRLRTLLRGQENIRESTGRADDPVEGPWVLVTKHCHPVGEVSVLFSKRSCVVSERTETGKEGGRVRARQADLPLACAPPPPVPRPRPVPRPWPVPRPARLQG